LTIFLFEKEFLESWFLTLREGKAVKKNALTSILLVIFLWAFNAESPGQVYKYVDKKGVTHFTNVPADPQYKPASGFINIKDAKKHRRSKSRRYSESIPPKNVKPASQPSSDQKP
jgi:hypothetical protein